MNTKRILVSSIITLIAIVLFFSIKNDVYHLLTELLIIMLSFTIGIITYHTKDIFNKQLVVFIGSSFFLFVVLNIFQIVNTNPNATSIFPTSEQYHLLSILYLSIIMFVGLFIIKQDKEINVVKLLFIESIVIIIIAYLFTGINIFPNSMKPSTQETLKLIFISTGLLLTLVNIISILINRKEHSKSFHYLIVLNVSLLLTLIFSLFGTDITNILMYTFKLLAVLSLFQLLITYGITKPFKESLQTLEEQNEKLHKLVRIDDLTQIPNRFYLFENLDKTFRYSKREQQTLVMLMIDIDDFKGFNDTFGHLHGDSILTRVATAIKKECRRPLDFVGRYGGEEFLAVLPNSDFEAGRILSDRINKAVRDLRIVHFKNKNQFLSVSIGYVSITPKQDIEIDYPLQEADNQLYKIKSMGKNSYLGKDLDKEGE